MSKIMREKLESLRSDWNILSDSEDMGCFNFETLAVEIYSFTSEDAKGFDVDSFNVNDNLMAFNNFKKYQVLMVHEFTHYIDTVNTVWGLEYLLSMKKGYASSEYYDPNFRNEEAFFYSKFFFDKSRSIKMPSYYTQIFDVDDSFGEWNIRMTSGVVFCSKGMISGRPIFFGSFLNKNEERLVRSPVSMISLLEASASIQEYYVEYELIKRLSGDRQLHCKSQFEEHLKEQLYNRNMTEYSVCLHWVANRQLCVSIDMVIPLTKILLDVCMNIPNEMMSDLDVIKIYYSNDFYRKNVDRQSQSFVRIKDGIRRYHDRGALFYLLVDLLPSESYKNPVAGLDMVLKFSGLSYKIVMDAARKKVVDLVASISDGNVVALKSIVQGVVNDFNVLHPVDYLG